MTRDDDARSILEIAADARARFLSLVAAVRPELHRYCARMTGSVFDGEDVLQETLAKAHFALGQMAEPPELRPWLFRIAHNTAMDHLRRYERKNVDLVAEVPEPPAAEDPERDPALVNAAIAVFAALPPAQRSALVLKDVLGHSLEETATTMGTTVPAVKAALVRARRNVAPATPNEPASKPDARAVANTKRYADLFNARDWDGLRALLATEAKLDLVSRHERQGAAVREYYGRYAEVAPTEHLRAEATLVDGRLALAIFRGDARAPSYFILLEWDDAVVERIRDFRYVPYIAESGRCTPIED